LKLKLKNEQEDFIFSSTGIEAFYSDDGRAEIKLTAKKSSDCNKIYLIELRFEIVAEVACKTINFHDNFYREIEIQGNSKEYSGFYLVVDSERLRSMAGVYDPKNRLNLKHYIVAGGDGHIELIVSSYTLNAKFIDDLSDHSV